MKKIINGKVYDTATATSLAVRENAFGPGDLNYLREELYRKRTGEFFLHGEGGARTCYATIDGGRMTPGEAILPLNYEAARRWAEEHLSADAYEGIFGAIQEDDTRKNLTISLPAGLIERIKRESAEAGLGLSAYVENLLTK